MEYTVASGKVMAELIQVVNKLITLCWKPIGGLALDCNYHLLYQAMAREMT